MSAPETTLSVAVPCFGGSDHLPALISSLEVVPAQEILILDDGNPEPIHSSWPDPRVRVVRHDQNQGLAAARNSLVENAGSELLLFVDADVVLTSWSDRLIESFSRDPRLAAVTGRAIEDGSGHVANRWRRWFWVQDHGEQPAEVDFAYGLCSTWRRSVLHELGGFDPQLRSHGEDIDISLRARRRGHRILHDPELVVQHFRRDRFGSLLRMVWNHSFHFSRICRRHRDPLYARALANAFRWLPISVYSSVVRHRDPAMACVAVPACTVSIVARLWAGLQPR